MLQFYAEDSGRFIGGDLDVIRSLNPSFDDWLAQHRNELKAAVN